MTTIAHSLGPIAAGLVGTTSIPMQNALASAADITPTFPAGTLKGRGRSGSVWRMRRQESEIIR